MIVVRRSIVWTCFALCLAGCGQAVGTPVGKVTFQGQPVGGADVKFTSLVNANEEYTGLSRPDGTYQVSYRELDGLPVGKYKVAVTRYVLPNGKPLPAGEQGDALKNDGKARGQVFAFERVIVSGENAVDFDLSQAKSPSAAK